MEFVRKIILASALVLFCSIEGRGQAARVDDIIISNVGGTLHSGGSLTVTVCTNLASGTPCSPKATIYTDVTAGTTAANPFTADANGNYGFWIFPGTYIVTITGSIPTPYTKTYTVGPTLTSNNTFTSLGTFANANEFNHLTLNIGNVNINSELVIGQGSGSVLTGLTGAVNCPSGSLTFICNAVTGIAVNNTPNANAIAGYFQVRGTANNTLNFGVNQECVDTVGLTTGVIFNCDESTVIPLNAPSAYSSVVGFLATIGSPGGPSGTYGDAFVASGNNLGNAFWGNGLRCADGFVVNCLYIGKAAASGASGSQILKFQNNTGSGNQTSTLSTDSTGHYLINYIGGNQFILGNVFRMTSTIPVSWAPGSDPTVGGDVAVCRIQANNIDVSANETCAPTGGLAALNLTATKFISTATTVGSLPSAASNSGVIMTVTDSTTVSAEGQTCVGGSNVKALAFSNGSVWKCF